MAKAWSEVEQSKDYQALDEAEKAMAKSEYFDQVVSAKDEFKSLKPEEQVAARSEFLGPESSGPSPTVNLSEDEKNIKEPFPYLNWIPGGKELNKGLVDAATYARDTNPAAFHLMNQSEQMKAGVVEGATGGIPRAIIEKMTGYEISKGNLAGRIVGSLLPISYMTNAMKAAQTPKIVKNAIEGAVAMNLVEGMPADDFLNIEKRIKLSAGGAAMGVLVPAAIEGGVGIAKSVLSVGKLATAESQRVIGQLLNATHVKDYAYGKNPPRAVIEALGKDLPSSTMQELQAKVQEAIPRYVQKAKDAVAKGQGNKLLNLFDPINNEIGNAINEAVKGGKNNEALVKRLTNLGDAINFEQTVNIRTGEVTNGAMKQLNGITPEQAVILKQEIGKLAKWTGNASDDKLVNMTTKKLYGIVNSAVTDAVPESAKANEIVSGLMSADNLLNRKVVYEQGAPQFKGAGKIVGTAGVLYGLASKNPTMIKEGIAVLGLGKIMNSTEAQTKLAYGLSSISKEAQIDIFTRYPKLKPVLDPIMQKFKNSTTVAVAIANAKHAGDIAKRITPAVSGMAPSIYRESQK